MVTHVDDSPTQLYIDACIVMRLLSPQAFEGMRMRGPEIIPS